MNLDGLCRCLLLPLKKGFVNFILYEALIIRNDYCLHDHHHACLNF